MGLPLSHLAARIFVPGFLAVIFAVGGAPGNVFTVFPPSPVLAQETADEEDISRDVLAAQFKQGVAEYDAKNYSRAFELWLPLARDGDLAAQRNVAHMLRLGRGVKQDLQRARSFYERSAEFGFVTAQTNLAVMLLNGEGGSEDPEAAAVWFDRAARGGHPIAQYHLATLYERGIGVEADTARALGWYALAARGGHQGALNRLADLVPTLPGPAANQQAPEPETLPEIVPEEPADATAVNEITAPDTGATDASTLEQPADANDDDADATEEAAPPGDIAAALDAYRSRKFTDALLAFEAMAYRGNTEAQYRLARMRNRGEGEPRDPVAALAWWSIAAAAGHEKSEVAATQLRSELGPGRRDDAEREAAQFMALIGQLTGTTRGSEPAAERPTQTVEE